MAGVVASPPSPELLAITKNTHNLCNGITTASTVTAFAQSLEERGFVTSSAKNSILQTRGIAPVQQCDMFLDAVKEQVRLDPTKFESFVEIFRCEAALSIHADLVIKTHEIETANLHSTTLTRHHDPPKQQIKEIVNSPQPAPTDQLPTQRDSVKTILEPNVEKRAAEIAKIRQLTTEEERLISGKDQQQRMGGEVADKLPQSQGEGVQQQRKSTFNRPLNTRNDDVTVSSSEKALYDAVERGDVSTVRQLVASNVNINCTPYPDHWTPLMTASFEGHVDIVKIMIEAKAQINTQNEEGETALYLAAQGGKVDVVRLLTEAQAQVNIQTEDGMTALYIAIMKGHEAVVQLLIQQHADVNICKKGGWTPLMTASLEGHVDIVRTLIEAKAQINTQKEDGVTALNLAAAEGKLDVVRLLTEAQAQVNIQTEDCRTALCIASLKGHGAVVKLLLQQHADVSICKDGWTPLMAASLGGHVDIVRILIEAKAQINTQREDGVTALHMAAAEGKVDVVRLLTEAQAQVNIQTETGATPLYMASQNGHGDVVNILIRNGADVNLSWEGQKPIDVARSHGHSGIVRILRRHGN